MLSYREINEILKNFDTSLYNKKQIGSNKPLVISIYNYFSKLKVSREVMDVLVTHIAYLYQENLNIPLYLEILSKSLGFINEYSLKDLFLVVRDVHDIYYRESLDVTLEEYFHDSTESILRKLYLDRNGKYLNKNFGSDFCLNYIDDLKLVAAMSLEQKEYNEFISYIDEFIKYQMSYSPFKLFRIYLKLRKKLKGTTCLFWDIVYGNEYILSLYKSHIEISEIYKNNVYLLDSSVRYAENLSVYNQENFRINEDVKYFQLCTVYNSKELLGFKQEKDLIKYYNTLISRSRKDIIVLPKLKGEVKTKYSYNVN